MSQVNVLSTQNLVAIVKSNNKCKILKEFRNNPHIPIYLEIRMPDFFFFIINNNGIKSTNFCYRSPT